ncbi:MAG TPA: hypothetical protein G4N98_00010 [Thermoflexia bacterium]|nr:hypothetical protein [Thermoflexia bacterium]
MYGIEFTPDALEDLKTFRKFEQQKIISGVDAQLQDEPALALEEWQGFEIGDSDDFEQEVQATIANQELLTFLAARRSGGPRVSLAEVKRQLGLN